MGTNDRKMQRDVAKMTSSRLSRGIGNTSRSHASGTQRATARDGNRRSLRVSARRGPAGGVVTGSNSGAAAGGRRGVLPRGGHVVYVDQVSVKGLLALEASAATGAGPLVADEVGDVDTVVSELVIFTHVPAVEQFATRAASEAIVNRVPMSLRCVLVNVDAIELSKSREACYSAL